jgi:sugar lactone lactonase YvrE
MAPFGAVPGPGALTSVAVGRAGDVWVGIDETTEDAGKVQHLTAAGAPDRSVALPPEATGVTALAREAAGVFVGTATPALIFRLPDAGASLVKYAEIPNVTPCLPPVITTSCDGSFADAAPRISAMASDVAGNLYVADSAQGAIWLVKPDKSVVQLLVEPEWVSPATPSGPTGLALDGGGNLVIAVASTRTEDVGAVFLQKITGGKAGTRTQLATTGSSSRPAGLVLSRSGRMLISLAGTGRVLVLDRTGKQLSQTPAARIPALKAPSGLVFRGTSLLVASNTSPGKGGQIVRLPVGETGGGSR